MTCHYFSEHCLHVATLKFKLQLRIRIHRSFKICWHITLFSILKFGTCLSWWSDTGSVNLNPGPQLYTTLHTVGYVHDTYMIWYLSHVAHVCNKSGFRLVEGIWLHRKSLQTRFFSKRPILLHMCAKCYELSSYSFTMVMSGCKNHFVLRFTGWEIQFFTNSRWRPRGDWYRAFI